MFALCCAALGLTAGAMAPGVARWAADGARRAAGGVPFGDAAPTRAGRAAAAAASATASGAVGWAVGPVPAVPAFLALALVGVPLAVADRRCLRLPDRLLLVAAVPAVGTLAGTAAYGGEGVRLARAGLAGAAVGGAYLALGLAPRAALGLGDVKLAALLGFALGWLGWPAALAGAVLPHLLAGPVAALLLVTGRAGPRTRIPFGPALLGGALSTLVLWRLGAL